MIVRTHTAVPASDDATLDDLRAQIAALERQVEAKDRLLRDIGALARVGAWELDPVTTRVIGNREAAAILDVDAASALVEADVLRFFPEPSASQLRRSLLDAARDGSPIDLELRAVTAAKQSKWVRVVGHADLAETGLIRLRGAVQDITGNKLTQEALKDSEAFIRTVLDSLSEAIAVLDAQGVILVVNETWGRLAAALSTDAGLTTPPEVRIGIRKVLDGEATFFRSECRLQTSDGERWFAVKVTPMDSGSGGAVIVAAEITARKHAEAVLAESQERYRSLMMAMSEGVVLQDDNAAIIAFNDSAQRILGLTADQLVGRSSFDPRWRVIHEDGSPFAGETHPAVLTLRTGEPQENVVMGVYKPDGALTWISVSVQPLFRQGAPKPWRVVVTMRDITDQRRAEQEASIAQAMLQAEFDLSPDAMLVVGQNGVRLSYNTQYLEMWGLTQTILENEDHEAVRRWAAPLLIDPEGYLQSTREIEADLEGYSYDELRLRDGRTIERYSAPLRLEVGEIRGRVWFFRDITERLKSAADQSLLAAIVESSPDAIGSVDLEGRVTTWNRSAEIMLGITAEEIMGRTRESRSVEETVGEGFDEIMARIRSGAEPGVYEVRRLRKDGAPIDLSVVVSSIRSPEGKIIGGAYVARDITTRVRAEAELVRLARYDTLTNLLNRGSFVAALGAEIAARRDERTMAVLLVDLDHFKDINDTLGYHTGDRLLIDVANRLTAAVGERGVVARFSANAFAILFARLEGSFEVEREAQRLLDLIAEPLMLDGSPIRIGASMGIAVIGREPLDAGTHLSQADVALHHAKRENPGSFRYYTQVMDEAAHRRMQLGSDLRAAMAGEQFFLVYQPQADAKTGAIVGIEALIRWRHPKRGVVAAGEFMPIAERIGLAPVIGRWVVGETCRQIRAWLDAGLMPPPVAVNLSATQFNPHAELERDLEDALARHRLSPQHLELELTETVLMESAVWRNDMLTRLRARGFSLSIDDFGTGYSSLDYLRRFPVDRIKIDQSFVRNLDSTRGAEAIVKAIIGLAAQLGMSVIVEGIETKAQRDLLYQWNCRYMQGYYFSRPVDATVLTGYFETDRRLPI
jgi:diguanylate cyclase (GGDEF)-like protein/PAS domain S-box-containing protein